MRSTDSGDAAGPAWPGSGQPGAVSGGSGGLDRSLDLGWDAGYGLDDEPGPGVEIDDVELIESVLSDGVDPWSLVMLAGIDPETLLDPIHRVCYLRAMDAVGAYVAARQQRALVAVAGSASSGDLRTERHVEHEVAIARRSTRGRAGRDIEVARTLREEFRDTAAALERGEISLEHAAALVTGTRHVAGAAARAEVERRVLPHGPVTSPVRFRRHVDAAVCAVDAEDQTRRHARARAERQVWVRRVENGLGELVVIDEWSVVSGIYARITAHATDLQRERRAASRDLAPGLPGAAADGAVGAGSPGLATADSPGVATVGDEWADRTLDNCRADALSDLVLHDHDDDSDSDSEDDVDSDVGGDTRRGLDDRGGRDPAGTQPRPHHRHHRRRRRGPRIEGRLVIDLATLRGETDNPCLLDGSPVPAQVGRRLARDITHWRRMVTDPVDGHLLDYGRRTYLPEPLRAFVLERDRTCRNPWCDQPATRCQLDHATEFPDGPSNTTNTGPLCGDCHRIKTDHAAVLDHSTADGSATWRTAWGQTVPIPPTRYLDDGATPDRAVSGIGQAPGVLDHLADHPAPRSFDPPDDPGEAPPF